MDPLIRNFVLFAGLAFCVLFGALTIAVVVENGIDLLVVLSLAILGLVLLGVIGAIRNPPPR